MNFKFSLKVYKFMRGLLTITIDKKKKQIITLYTVLKVIH